MPIEIQELIITARVEATDRSSSFANLPPEQMKVVVKQCVEQVIEILKEKQER